jgi:HAD superfamily hydrolase (TIGR01490 family)
LNMANPKQKLAVFDIDGTIFRSSLLIEIVEEMIGSGLFPKEVSKEYEKSYTAWLDRKGSYEEYIGDVVKVFRGNIKGVHYPKFADIAGEVIDVKKYRTYLYTRDLISQLKKDGYFLLAISQSPKTVVDEFCGYLGFDKVYGWMYELGPQNMFTGNSIDEHLIANKANIVKRVLEKESLTLKQSVGVGDTESDIGFLEMVERPICFNPNNSLYRYAKLNGWKVVVERKDVIYEIQ